MKSLYSLVGMLFITGCGTTQIWYQPNKTAADANRDVAECRMEASRISNPLAVINGWAFLADDARKKDFVKDCMISKGWQIVPVTAVTNGQQYPSPP